MQKANKLKEAKAEKRTNMKKNTAIKVMKVEEGEDDATSKLHPQHFLFRPPVVGLDKVWNLYRKDWEEKYYFV